MDKKIKLAVIGLTALLLVSFFIIFQLNSAKQTLERQIEKLQLDISGLTRQMDSLSLEKRQMEERFSLVKSDLDKVAVEKEELVKKFESADKARQELSDRIRLISTQGDALKKQVENLSAQKRAVDKELAELKAKHELYKKKYGQMSRMLKERSVEGAAAENPAPAPVVSSEPAAKVPAGGIVELPPIIVRPRPSGAPGAASNYSGEIIAINREDNFVVVDIGKNSGLKIGDRLKVFRGEKLVGNLEIIEIRETISACDIKKEFWDLKVGDQIK